MTLRATNSDEDETGGGIQTPGQELCTVTSALLRSR